MKIFGEDVISLYNYWEKHRKEYSSIGYETFVKYFQYLKNDISFKPSRLNELSEKDFSDVFEFCKKPKYERMRLVYIFTCSKRHGSDYFVKHAAKGRETKRKRYGDNFDKLMMRKAKESGLKRNPNMIEDSWKKAYSTKLKRYGKEGLSQMARDIAAKAIETKKNKY